MSFLSFEFPVLLTAVLLALILIRNPTGRKWILLIASCAFYAWWDWRFLGLLIFVTAMDYFISVQLVLSQAVRARKALLAVSVTVNLLILGFFKYFNFFTATFNTLLARFGFHLPELQIILPIGISFYTFETLSYVIDVYRGRTPPAKSLLDYSVFVTFFPRLVSGPIMRASHFLPQLERGVEFSRENFIRGAYFFGQGLVKKVVVADTIAIMTDQVYSVPWVFSSGTVWLGVLAFGVQVYFDFSGYSDMATGVARLFGFELPVNFNLPFTSRSLTEFWQRWHISLSSWLRDYLYIPLGGNRKGNARTFFNMFVTMLLGGLWHGANWTYVLWGGAHGAALAAERMVHHADPAADWRFRRDWWKGILIFVWIGLACILFRSPSLTIVREVAGKILFIHPEGVNWYFAPAAFYTLIVLAGGFFLRARKIDLAHIDLNQSFVLPMIAAQYLFAFLFSAGGNSPFIYFQF
jgi:alginate O-acetyltransferase complex protein AlgI